MLSPSTNPWDSSPQEVSANPVMKATWPRGGETQPPAAAHFCNIFGRNGHVNRRFFKATGLRIVYFILTEVEGSSVSSRHKGIISSFRNEVTKTHYSPWWEQPGFPRFLPSPPSVHVAAGGSGLLAGCQDSTWYSSVDASL